MLEYIKKNAIWLIPILLMAVIAPFTPALDLDISRYFYRDGQFSQSHFLKMVFAYGPVPADIAALLSLLALASSYMFSSCKNWRPYALYLVLTIAVGSGIITHVILKDHWGRSRPVRIEEFGGQQKFTPFYQPNFFQQKEPSKSFPCGHCSVGFYFFAFIFMGRRLHKKWLVYLGIFLGIFLGVLLSYTRIAQGGHFFSDTLMAALVMWLTALFLDRIILGKINERAN